MLLATVVVLLSAIAVTAAPVNLTGENLTTSTYAFSTPTHIYGAAPGNISQVNFTTNSTSNRWEAYTGNITSTTFLGDSTGATIFNWQTTTVTGEIYLTTFTGVPDFSTLTNTTSQELSNMDATNNWSFTSGDDQIVDTFTSAFAFTVDGSSIMTHAVNTTGPFVTGILNGTRSSVTDGSRDNFMFVVNVTENSPGYNGALTDYEVMVPSLSTDTWYFYAELD